MLIFKQIRQIRSICGRYICPKIAKNAAKKDFFAKIFAHVRKKQYFCKKFTYNYTNHGIFSRNIGLGGKS